jgi:hypothetical protein
MFLSIHIPKTAGTTLAKIFDDTSLRRVMYDYGTERDLTAVRRCPDEVREHRDFIQSYFQYLHGHFHYLKYADVFPQSPVIATIRHPVDRVISQYFHIIRDGDPNNKRHKRIMNGEMNVVEFSKIDFIGNAQWYYLEGRPIKDYDFIFIQEQLAKSLELFCMTFNKPQISEYLSWFGGVPTINKKPKWSSGALSLRLGLFLKNNFHKRQSLLHSSRPPISISKSDKQKIYSYCEQDVEVYRLAVEKLSKIK